MERAGQSTEVRATGGWRRTLRGAAALYALGMVGVLALAVASVPGLRATPGLEALSTPMLVVVAAANSTLLLAVFVLLGAATAPRVGLRSHVFDHVKGRDPDWGGFRRSLPVAAVVGAGLFGIVVVLDAGISAVVTVGVNVIGGDSASLVLLARSVPTRLLYGGITEELLLRWGVMAPLAWVLWRARGALGHPTPGPTAATMWAAIAGSALLFGLGHLPALAASLGLTPGLVVRTVLLNAVAGVGLGWLFWRRSLETAMVAHAAFHVVLLVVSVVGILAG